MSAPSSSPMHLCQGQEAVAVGACHALRPDDQMTCTYHGHGGSPEAVRRAAAF